MSTQHFKTTIVTAGTQTYVLLPFDPNDVWGAKERHYVCGSIGEHRIRTRIDSNGPPYMITLGPAWMRDRDVAVGSEVEVTLAPEGPMADNVSPDVAAALNEEPEARAFFESLATFYRNNFIRGIESAKRPETRSRRITEMMQLLKAGKRER